MSEQKAVLCAENKSSIPVPITMLKKHVRCLQFPFKLGFAREEFDHSKCNFIVPCPAETDCL